MPYLISDWSQEIVRAGLPSEKFKSNSFWGWQIYEDDDKDNDNENSFAISDDSDEENYADNVNEI